MWTHMKREFGTQYDPYVTADQDLTFYNHKNGKKAITHQILHYILEDSTEWDKLHLKYCILRR